MSAQFKIYIVDNNEEPILISDYKPNNETPTFNENLTQDENNNFTLSFSISQNYKDYFPQNFNLFEYLKIGRRLILEKPKTKEEILFTIESISPEGRNKDIIWNIVAKDYISYNFSKNNIGLNINTFESDDYLKWVEDNFLEGTASDIINYILQKGYLQEANFFSEINNEGFLENNWKCAFFETNINTFKTKGLEIQENPLNKKINIDISNSNTYNALIEVALITESFILFDFKKKLVDLISRNDDFFRKNYILSPEFNLKDLSLTYSGDEFYPILYVTGGQDEFGLATTLIPFLTYKQYLILKDYFETAVDINFQSYENDFYDNEDINWEGDAPTKETLLILNSIPYLDSFIINLTYYLENDLIDPNDRNEIMNRIYNDLRKINLEFQREIFNFYTTQGNINEIESRILSITDQVVFSEENDYLSLNEKLSSVYLKSGGGILDPELKAESNINPQEVFADTELTKESLYDDGYLFYEISKEAYEYLESLQPPFSNFDPLTDPPSKIQEKQVYKDDSDSLNIKYYASTNFKLRYPIELKFEKDEIVNSNITFTSTASSHIFDQVKPEWTSGADRYRFLIRTKDINEIDKLKIEPANLDVLAQKYEKEWITTNFSVDNTIIEESQEIPTNVSVGSFFTRTDSLNNLARRYQRIGLGQEQTLVSFSSTTVNTMPLYGKWFRYGNLFGDLNPQSQSGIARLLELPTLYINIDSTKFITINRATLNGATPHFYITVRNVSNGALLSNNTATGDFIATPSDFIINNAEYIDGILYITIRNPNNNIYKVYFFNYNPSTNIFTPSGNVLEKRYNSSYWNEGRETYQKLFSLTAEATAVPPRPLRWGERWRLYIENKFTFTLALDFESKQKAQFLRAQPHEGGSEIDVLELSGDAFIYGVESNSRVVAGSSQDSQPHWILAFTRSSPSIGSTKYFLKTLRGNNIVDHNESIELGIVKYSYIDRNRDIIFIMTELRIFVWKMNWSGLTFSFQKRSFLFFSGGFEGIISTRQILYVKRSGLLYAYDISSDNLNSWPTSPTWISVNRPIQYWDRKSHFLYGLNNQIIFKSSNLTSAFQRFFGYSPPTTQQQIPQPLDTASENGLALEFVNYQQNKKQILRRQWKPFTTFSSLSNFFPEPTIPNATLQSTSLQYITNLVTTDFRLMPYFELLRVYGGLDFLENREKELEDLCLDFIELKNESEEAIQNTLQNEDFSEYSVLETRIDSYKALVGDATGFIKNNLENQELYQSNFRRPKELKWNSIGSNLKIINKNLISFSDGSSTATTFIDVEQNIKEGDVYYYKAKFKNLENVAIDFNVFVPGDSSFWRLEPNTWETVEGLFTGIS